MSDDVQKLILGGSAILLGIAGFLAGGGEPRDLDPVGLAPAEARCPIGWEFEEVLDHAPAQTCTQGTITVTLYPYEKKANHGLDTAGGPDATTMSCQTLVALHKWPPDWCS